MSNQSRGDEAVTQRISKLNENLEVEMLDHYFMGKKEVLSFADKVGWFKSDNADYQRKIDNKKLVCQH